MDDVWTLVRVEMEGEPDGRHFAVMTADRGIAIRRVLKEFRTDVSWHFKQITANLRSDRLDHGEGLPLLRP